MSDWDDFRRFRSAPKRPPPEHGIRIGKVGTTWWGQRWIEALEHVLGADAGRLGRGRSYARAGRAHDLEAHGGVVTARVTGSRPEPYDVRIELSQLGAEQWQAAIAGMAAKAQFSAELLAGQMPRAIDEVFLAAGASVFPTRRSELITTCSCPDWGDPCKHVAATHYVLGEALDRDPFLLFELRGRTRDEVLGALRAAREGGSGDEAGASGKNPGAAPVPDVDEVPRVTLDLEAADYDRPRAPLPALDFSFDEPRAHGAVLRQLGAPPAWRAKESPGASFEDWIRDAAQRARRMALAETETANEDETATETAAEARPDARARKKAPRPKKKKKAATRRRKAAPTPTRR